jgi:hypothetical protein
MPPIYFCGIILRHSLQLSLNSIGSKASEVNCRVSGIYIIYIFSFQNINQIKLKMRLNWNLKIPARVPQKEPVPFQEILPLRLKKTVSGKGDKTSGL